MLSCLALWKRRTWENTHPPRQAFLHQNQKAPPLSASEFWTNKLCPPCRLLPPSGTKSNNGRTPPDPAALPAHYAQAVTMFSIITTHDNTIVSHQCSYHTPNNWRTQDPRTPLHGELNEANKILGKNRATIKALSACATGPGGGGCPVPIPDPAGFDGIKEDLKVLLDSLEDKLRGDTTQFTSERHQISYAVSQRTGDVFEQILGPYSSFTTIKELTDTLKAGFGDPDPTAFTPISNCFTITEETKIFTLHSSLSPALKQETPLELNPPTAWDSFVS